MACETIGDAFDAFVYSQDEGKEVVEQVRNVRIQKDWSVLTYCRLKGDDSTFPAFVVLVPSLAERLADDFAAEATTTTEESGAMRETDIKCIDAVRDCFSKMKEFSTVIAGAAARSLSLLNDQSVSPSDRITSLAEIGRASELTQVSAACAQTVQTMTAGRVSASLERLGRKTLGLMSYEEQSVFSWLLACHCLLDDCGAGNSVCERCDAFIKVLAAFVPADDKTQSRSFKLLICIFAVVLCTSLIHKPETLWFASHRDESTSFKTILTDLLPLPMSFKTLLP